MSQTSGSRQVRARLVETLRRELMGPSDDTEVIREYPTSRYVVGRLAPAQQADDDTDAVIDPAENDSLAVAGEDNEDGGEESSPPLIIGFNPSSFGLSFLVDPAIQDLSVTVSWGDYCREKDDSNASVWRRYPRAGVVEGLSVAGVGPLPRITLSPTASNPSGVAVSGVDDPEIVLEGIVHDFAGYRAVSLFLVNRRTKRSSRGPEQGSTMDLPAEPDREHARSPTGFCGEGLRCGSTPS